MHIIPALLLTLQPTHVNKQLYVNFCQLHLCSCWLLELPICKTTSLHRRSLALFSLHELITQTMNIMLTSYQSQSHCVAHSLHQNYLLPVTMSTHAYYAIHCWWLLHLRMISWDLCQLLQPTPMFLLPMCIYGLSSAVDICWTSTPSWTMLPFTAMSLLLSVNTVPIPITGLQRIPHSYGNYTKP